MAERILIVDDDAEFRSELCDFLQGYEVAEACSGQECLKILKRANNIALVILDVMMPGLSGIDVLTQIKKTDPELGIIILTGYSSKDVAIEALKGHADDYIEKPLDVNRIRETIDRVLESRRPKVNIDGNDMKGRIEKVKQFIERNRHKKTSLNDAASAVYLSPKYLSRLFKESTGTSFNDYRLKIKVEEAKKMLKGSVFNINSVSDKLGYQNAESFIRCFKKITGLTPTEFRKKTRAKRLKKRK